MNKHMSELPNRAQWAQKDSFVDTELDVYKWYEYLEFRFPVLLPYFTVGTPLYFSLVK